MVQLPRSIVVLGAAETGAAELASRLSSALAAFPCLACLPERHPRTVMTLRC